MCYVIHVLIELLSWVEHVLIKTVMKLVVILRIIKG